MSRTQLLLAALFVTSVFPSCKKEYACRCELRQGVSMPFPWITDYKVKGKNRDQAASQCNTYDSHYRDCSLK